MVDEQLTAAELELETTRQQIADNIELLSQKLNPKVYVDNFKQKVTQFFNQPVGKFVAGGIALLIVRRIWRKLRRK